jgi:hypothetical protein
MSEIEILSRQLNELELIKTDVVSFKIEVDQPEGVAAYSDTQPAPTKSITLSGWDYTKTLSNSDKYNYYFYSNSLMNPFSIKELRNFWMVVTLYSTASISTIPFLVLYTLPTGTGDAQPWYHSKISYSFSPHASVYAGEKILLYAGNNKPQFHKNLRHIRLNQVIVDGDGLSTEIVNLLSAQSNSANPVGFRVCTHSVGWENNETKINTLLR